MLEIDLNAMLVKVCGPQCMCINYKTKILVTLWEKVLFCVK